jgi:hypothetical protein
VNRVQLWAMLSSLDATPAEDTIAFPAGDSDGCVAVRIGRGYVVARGSMLTPRGLASDAVPIETLLATAAAAEDDPLDQAFRQLLQSDARRPLVRALMAGAGARAGGRGVAASAEALGAWGPWGGWGQWGPGDDGSSSSDAAEGRGPRGGASERWGDADDFVAGGYLTETYARKGWLQRRLQHVSHGAYDIGLDNGTCTHTPRPAPQALGRTDKETRRETTVCLSGTMQPTSLSTTAPPAS